MKSLASEFYLNFQMANPNDINNYVFVLVCSSIVNIILNFGGIEVFYKYFCIYFQISIFKFKYLNVGYCDINFLYKFVITKLQLFDDPKTTYKHN